MWNEEEYQYPGIPWYRNPDEEFRRHQRNDQNRDSEVRALAHRARIGEIGYHNLRLAARLGDNASQEVIASQEIITPSSLMTRNLTEFCQDNSEPLRIRSILLNFAIDCLARQQYIWEVLLPGDSELSNLVATFRTGINEPYDMPAPWARMSVDLFHYLRIMMERIPLVVDNYQHEVYLLQGGTGLTGNERHYTLYNLMEAAVTIAQAIRYQRSDSSQGPSAFYQNKPLSPQHCDKFIKFIETIRKKILAAVGYYARFTKEIHPNVPRKVIRKTLDTAERRALAAERLWQKQHLIDLLKA